MSASKDTVIIIRIPHNLKRLFKKRCDRKETTMSKELIGYIEDRVSKVNRKTQRLHGKRKKTSHDSND